MEDLEFHEKLCVPLGRSRLPGIGGLRYNDRNQEIHHRSSDMAEHFLASVDEPMSEAFAQLQDGHPAILAREGAVPWELVKQESRWINA